MAEKYKGVNNSSSIQTKKYRHEKNMNIRKKRYLSESKTPPLPSNHRNTIEELIRQRQSIQEELQTISKHAEVDHKISLKKKRKHDQDKNLLTKIPQNKSKIPATHATKTMSPEPNADKDLDSEDEEYIIEQRRKRRKKLLEHLNIVQSKEDKSRTLKNTCKEPTNLIKQNVEKEEMPEEKSQKINNLNDMFSEDIFLHKNNKIVQEKNENNTTLTDNWDDEEGYYKIKIGEEMNKYTVKDLFGQGVFANVVKAQDNSQNKTDVAIKIIRNNDLMYKTGLKEIAILKEINICDPENKNHCVKFFSQFMHKGHLCLVFECLYMDLRSVLKKYGKNKGINIKPVMSYSRQLFIALRYLNKIGIIHADIKPDNILVNEKKNILKLCDFGSATKDQYSEPTPYLVSRFYRAPEIILGIPHTHSIDIWSAACTIYEISTGKIMFIGNSNNKMLKCFMDLKGKIPHRLLRKGIFKDQHFNYNNNFLLHKKDEFTGREVVELPNINITRDLNKELLKSSLPSEKKKIGQLKDLLSKMFMLDSHQRLSINECLQHIFIREELQR